VSTTLRKIKKVVKYDLLVTPLLNIYQSSELRITS